MKGIYTTPSGEKMAFDLHRPQPIGLPFENKGGLRCFNAPPLRFTPFKEGDFEGAIELGSPVNFYNISINPHGNGTHTETVRHIADLPIYVGEVFDRYFFWAALRTLHPQHRPDGDALITRSQIVRAMESASPHVEALVVRTLPNTPSKRHRNYTGTNPPYFAPEAMEYLSERGIRHFLTDLPSVDREVDGGQLFAHKAFWNYPASPRISATITELIWVPDSLKDGDYILQLQPLPLRLDASPSCPVLYSLEA